MILTGAGLLGRSFLRLISVNPGFHRGASAAFGVFPAHATGLIDARPQGLPRVRFAGPFRGQRSFPDAKYSGHRSRGIHRRRARNDGCADGQFLLLNGQKPPASYDDWDRIAQNPDNAGHADYCVASTGYFKTMGIPLSARTRLRGPRRSRRDECRCDQRDPGTQPMAQSKSRRSR